MDTRTLDRLTRDERVRQPDMEIAAAAAVLDVGLDDIFLVDTLSTSDEGPVGTETSDDGEDDDLSPEQGQRLPELFDLQDYGRLTEAERAELDALAGTWGQPVSERWFRELAERRGITVEQARAKALADVDCALVWEREVQTDSTRLKALVNEAQERQRAHVG